MFSWNSYKIIPVPTATSSVTAPPKTPTVLMKLSIPTPNPVVHLQASESVDVSGQFPDMGTLVAERTARQTNRRDSAAD